MVPTKKSVTTDDDRVECDTGTGGHAAVTFVSDGVRFRTATRPFGVALCCYCYCCCSRRRRNVAAVFARLLPAMQFSMLPELNHDHTPLLKLVSAVVLQAPDRRRMTCYLL